MNIYGVKYYFRELHCQNDGKQVTNSTDQSPQAADTLSASQKILPPSPFYVTPSFTAVLPTAPYLPLSKPMSIQSTLSHATPKNAF